VRLIVLTLKSSDPAGFEELECDSASAEACGNLAAVLREGCKTVHIPQASIRDVRKAIEGVEDQFSVEIFPIPGRLAFAEFFIRKIPSPVSLGSLLSDAPA